MAASDLIVPREALWQSWLALQASADKAIQQSADYYFKEIRQTVCNKLAIDALNFARLGQKDEGVYDHLVYLMETYQDVIQVFENQPEAPAPDLVAGLCDILISRLRQFEDMAIGQGNPVSAEKRAILEKALFHTANQIENLKTEYQHTPHILGQQREAFLTAKADTLPASILAEILPAIQTYYQENLERCLASVNDLHTRKTASFYSDLLEREWEVLGLIIQVQVKAIESASGGTQHAPPILSKLREAYQQTGPVVSGFRKLLQSAPQAVSPDALLSHEELMARLTAPPSTELDGQPLLHALMQEADGLFECIRNGHLEIAHGLHATIGEEISLSEEVIIAFEEARQALIAGAQSSSCANESEDECPDENSNLDDCENQDGKNLVATSSDAETSNEPTVVTDVEPEPTIASDAITAEEVISAPDATADEVISGHTTADEAIATTQIAATSTIDTPPVPSPPSQEEEILTGITETLEIKIESLKESLESFQTNNANTLTALSSGIPTLAHTDLDAAATQLKTAWCATPPTEETIAEFLSESTNLEAFAAYNEKFTKLVTNAQAKIEKSALRFKKETLLYEISTFEEILYYSVSRLRESSLPHIVNAVETIDETFDTLKSLLAQSGITIIRPAPHEPFNGREHEVLTAEEQEDFAKGTVIKTMTSGYKLGDQIILRANVIAAR